MEIIEGKLYFIKDKFIEKYNPKYHLMENKETGTKRPTYFCFRDKIDKNILWFVPMSSKYDKYLKLYNDIKSKKGIEPNNFVFARNLAGKKAVFLIQNRKSGVLTAMMEYLKNWSKEQGYKNLRIKTRNTRREMLSFLVKNNFNFYEIEAQENIRDNRICLEIHL